MAESTALVALPFYPPIRTGTGALFEFGAAPQSLLLPKPQAARAASEAYEGMAYTRSGLFVTEAWIGQLLNIYA